MRIVSALAGTAGLLAGTFAPGAAQGPVPPPDQQVAAALQPAPEPMQATATVMGYDADGHLAVIRQGGGELICLSDNPGMKGFHVVCYQKGLEPFMARGRELKAQGKDRAAIDSVREAEIAAGSLAMPREPMVLYELFGADSSYDWAIAKVKGAKPVYVVYIPYATEETTGISTTAAGGGMPWLMYPGKPWAHIMITP